MQRQENPLKIKGQTSIKFEPNCVSCKQPHSNNSQNYKETARCSHDHAQKKPTNQIQLKKYFYSEWSKLIKRMHRYTQNRENMISGKTVTSSRVLTPQT